MKYPKRMLAALLALILALGLALPAMAAGPQSAINWDDFYIITQPQNLTVAHGESFTLSVEVNVPDGVTVTYQWFSTQIGMATNAISGATQPVLTLSPDNPHYPIAFRPYQSTRASYIVHITAIAEDNDGNIIETRTLDSSRASVTVQAQRSMTFREWIRDSFIFAIPSLFGWLLFFVFLLPLVPISWFISLFR